MAKKSVKAIDLAKLIAPIISSRDVLDVLEKTILKTNVRLVDLDFINVEFVSRSAAHALLKIKEDLQRKFLNKKMINFINTDKDVAEMLRKVAANKAVPRKNIESLKIKKINLDTLLKNSSHYLQ